MRRRCVDQCLLTVASGERKVPEVRTAMCMRARGPSTSRAHGPRRKAARISASHAEDVLSGTHPQALQLVVLGPASRRGSGMARQGERARAGSEQPGSTALVSGGGSNREQGRKGGARPGAGGGCADESQPQPTSRP